MYLGLANSTTGSTANYGPINNWDVSQVTSMKLLFKDKSTFNSNISGWDVSNVKNMQQMFQHADNFNQPLNNWNVGNVTTIAICYMVPALLINLSIVGMYPRYYGNECYV